MIDHSLKTSQHNKKLQKTQQTLPRISFVGLGVRSLRCPGSKSQTVAARWQIPSTQGDLDWGKKECNYYSTLW